MHKTSKEQFEALVAPHLETLFRVAYRLVRNTQDAQDLVQDTCVAACAHFGAIAAAESPLRWLLRVQHNRFIDLHRRSGRSPVIAVEESEDLSMLVSDLPEPEELMQQLQSEQRLEEAFLQLNEMQRTLLSLSAEGYGLPEIAAISGLDQSVLSVRLHRARLKLAQLIAEANRPSGKVRQMRSGS